MSRVLIIGYGNPLRGDDGFGPAVAGRLLAAAHEPEVEVLAVHQLTPELMEPIGRARRVLFVDVRDGAPPGHLAVEPLEPQAAGRVNFTHFSTPAGLLAGALALYGAAPRAALLTAGAAGFDLGAPLSAPVLEAVEEAIGVVIPSWIREG